MNRRAFIATAWGIAAIGVSGCTDSAESADPDTGENDDTEPETEAETPESPSEEGAEPETEPAAAESASEDEWVTILEHEWTAIHEYDSDVVEDMYGVVGTGQNNHDQPIDVFVNAVFLDADGIQIGDSIDTADSVQPERKFSFELAFLEDDANRMDSYEIRWDAYER